MTVDRICKILQDNNFYPDCNMHIWVRENDIYITDEFLCDWEGSESEFQEFLHCLINQRKNKMENPLGKLSD
jgi:hypothetical protein